MEPTPASARPTPEMHDHRTHDLALIAGLAAGDLSHPDLARAQTILDGCTECRTVHADLIAIAAATRELPKRAAAPRDFRLGDDQAARLRRRSWLRALLSPFAGARSAAAPMAAAFTSLGLVGLLVVTILPGMLGSAASGGPERQTTGGIGAAAAATAAPAQPIDAVAPSTAPGPNGPGAGADKSATGAPDPEFGANVSPTGSTAPDALGQESDTGGALTQSTGTNPFLIGSLVLLAIGLALFGLRFAGRRLR